MMLDNKKIKAIRIILGFNDDLRIKLKYANKNSIFDFIDMHRFGLFGPDHELANRPAPDSNDWSDWEMKMWLAVSEVIG